MRNRMYGGVRGRKTKVGEKLLRFPPTRFIPLGVLMNGGGLHFMNPTSFFFMWWGTGGEAFRPKIAQTIIPVLKIFEIAFG